jgi:hypothetical protein
VRTKPTPPSPPPNAAAPLAGALAGWGPDSCASRRSENAQLLAALPDTWAALGACLAGYHPPCPAAEGGEARDEEAALALLVLSRLLAAGDGGGNAAAGAAGRRLGGATLGRADVRAALARIVALHEEPRAWRAAWELVPAASRVDAASAAGSSRQRNLALAMGLHPRLGRSSAVQALDTALLQVVAEAAAGVTVAALSILSRAAADGGVDGGEG